MSYYYGRDKNAMQCFIFANELPETFEEIIRKEIYPGKIETVKVGHSVDEINGMIDEYHEKNSHDRHWVVFRESESESSRRWEGHERVLSSWDDRSFSKAAYSIDELAEKGLWWDRVYFEPEWKELYSDFQKVIFLDIDGVLNHDDRKSYFEKDLLENLARLVQRTGAELILTSSWRRYYTAWATNGFPEDHEDFGWYLDDHLRSVGLKLQGATPIIFDGPDGRPFEVRRWLSRQADLKSFVILDDEPFWKWNWMQDHVVYTRGQIIGLTDERVEEAVKILGEK